MRVGPFEVLEELGRGGMGVVHRARSPSGEEVAIKILRGMEPRMLATFDRERRLIGQFTARDGFVPLLDAGESPYGPYLVMPLVPGGTLRDRTRPGPLAVEETLRIGRALAGALGRAHAVGIVHRDLKPENVIFTASGNPLVADLGLAKHFDRQAPGASQSVSLSGHGELRGTVAYMAPEQIADSKTVGPRADVFALGAILYECLAGRPAFDGANMIEVLGRISEGRVEPLRSVRPDAPASLVSVVERALSRDPAGRFAHGSDLLGALERATAARGARGRVVAGLVAAALGAVVLGAAFALRGPERSTEDAPPPPPIPRVEKVHELPLPPRLRLGSKARLARGTDVQVYLYRLPDGSDMELVGVPAGDFIAGTDDPDAPGPDRPRHTAPMDHAYWIGRNDVTWAQYRAFCVARRRGEPDKPFFFGRLERADEHPAVMVTWDSASQYCDWAGLALPAEAEWEKAARGTDGRTYPWGDDWDPGGKRCNFLDASYPFDEVMWGDPKARSHWDREHDDGYPFTSPVGSFPEGASPCGALDMAGNVFQLCSGWWAGDPDPGRGAGRPAPPTTRAFRLARGGSWDGGAAETVSAHRQGVKPGDRLPHVGFRVVLRRSP